jgi:competence protein ComEC
MLIGMGTSWLIKALSAFAHLIDSLPFSVIHDIPLNLTETVILYLLITTLVCFFLLKKKTSIPVALILILLLSLSLSERNMRQQKQMKMIVYSINKHSAIGLIHGNEAITFADSALLNSPRMMEFNVTGSLVALGIRKNAPACLDQKSTLHTYKTYPIHTVPGAVLMQWDTKRIGIVDSLPAFHKPLKPLALDYLIIRDNPKLRFSILLEWYHPRMIIADASNYHKRVKKLQKECRKAGIPFYDTRKSGALVVDFRN